MKLFITCYKDSNNSNEVICLVGNRVGPEVYKQLNKSYTHLVCQAMTSIKYPVRLLVWLDDNSTRLTLKIVPGVTTEEGLLEYKGILE